MRIVLVGAGNVAYSLSYALKKAGHDLVQIISRNRTHAESLARQLHVQNYSDTLENVAEAEIIIFSVSDSALPQLAQQISDVLNTRAKAQASHQPLILHTAGSMPIETIPYARRGVLYPMQTFTKQYLADFTHLPLFIEADTTQLQDELQHFAHTLSDQVFTLPSSERKYLHLAAVFCCNFANHCMTIGADILEKHHIPFQVMLPLIEGMTKKLYNLSPQKAQTGPAVRHDHNVMQQQEQALLDDQRQDLAHIYNILSTSIQKYTDHDK